MNDFDGVSDFELVRNIKENGDEDSSIFLFKKYKPLIEHYSYKVSFHGRDKSKKEDFRQDSYFKFLKCLNTINLKKIPKEIIKTWKFASRFKLYLRNLYKEYYVKFKKHYHYNVDYLENECIDKNNYSEIAENKIFFNEFIEDVRKNTIINDFCKNIFFDRLNGYTFKELDERYNKRDSEYYFNKAIFLILKSQKSNENLEYIF